MRNYGLVLSGGGAKGAYQIGCWRAFRKLGIDFDVVSGTSIGALNAALYCEGNYYKAVEYWRSLFTEDGIDIFNALDLLIEKAELNIEKIANCGKELIIATYNEEFHKTQYHRISDMPHYRLRKTIRASIACFGDPIIIQGKSHTDPGIDKLGNDNTPIKPIYESGVRAIAAIYLDPNQSTNKSEFPNAEIHDIIPPLHLGASKYLSDYKTQNLIEMGYNDTIESFKLSQKSERKYKWVTGIKLN